MSFHARTNRLSTHVGNPGCSDGIRHAHYGAVCVVSPRARPPVLIRRHERPWSHHQGKGSGGFYHGRLLAGAHLGNIIKTTPGMVDSPGRTPLRC